MLFRSAVEARQAIAQAEKQVSYTGNGTAGRENMTAPTGFFFQMPKAEKQEPVPRVVLREGSPTLLSDKAILPTDQRLYTQPDPDALHAAYMSGFHDGKKAQPKAAKQPKR